MYQKVPFVSQNWRLENQFCSMWVQLYINIDYSDYPKSFISRINEVYVVSIKYRYTDILLKKKINFI